MAINEILVRGNPDGTISGAHVVRWIADGTNADGTPRYKQSDPAPITIDDLSTLIGAQSAEVVAQAAQVKAAQDQVASLQAQVIQLKGVPTFKAEALLAQLTTEEKTQISESVANNVTLLPLWTAFLDRVAKKELPIDSPTVQAGITGLKGILGDARIQELFLKLNIDLIAQRWVR